MDGCPLSGEEGRNICDDLVTNFDEVSGFSDSNSQKLLETSSSNGATQPGGLTLLFSQLSMESGEEKASTELATEGVSSEERTCVQIVSAMKGSREKRGASPRTLSVTWAPDVYDPPPSSVSHFVNRGSKQQKSYRKDKKNGKKKGKNHHRGNGSKDPSRSGGKDKRKKQSSRAMGSSDGCLNLMDDKSWLIHAADKVESFSMGNSDIHCSSFVQQSLTKVHYSVAEAL